MRQFITVGGVSVLSVTTMGMLPRHWHQRAKELTTLLSLRALPRDGGLVAVITTWMEWSLYL